MSDPRALEAYLLGELSEDEAEAVEREYFRHGESFDELVAAEDDLIDDYLFGRMASDRRARFEARVLSDPGARERLDLARDLMERSRPETVPSGSSRRWLAVAGILLALGGVGAWALWSRGIARELGAERAARATVEREVGDLASRVGRLEREAAERERTVAELTARLATGALVRVLTVELRPGPDRGAEELRSVTVTAGVERVLLRLAVETDDHPGYAVSVETPEGRNVFRDEGLRWSARGSGRVVDALLPARLLSPGTYVVMLNGRDAGGSSRLLAGYAFRVVRPR